PPVAPDPAPAPKDERQALEHSPPEAAPEAVPEVVAEQPPRFDGTKGDAFNAELEKPGPAKGAAAKVEREIVRELAARELGIPANDAQLELFARNTAARVATAVRREDD